MATTTRTVVRQDAARLIGGLLWSGTATGGTTTTLVHTGAAGLRDTGMSDYMFEGAYVYLTSGADAGTWRMITPTGYTPSTGTLTVGEAWGTGPVNGTTYEVLGFFDPTRWNRLVDDALRKYRYRYRSPITLITDGDMEASGTSNWTASNSTLTKITSGTSTSDFIEGTQALRVANSGAAGYAQSVSVPTWASAGFTVWANYRALSGTAVLRAWDVTGAASISSSSGADSGTNNEGGMITFGFTAPASSRNIAIRLEGTQATADIYWDDVILMRAARRRYVLPSWIVERDMVDGFESRHGFRPGDFLYRQIPGPVDLEEDLTAVNLYRVNTPTGAAWPLYIFGQRNYGTLATDASTTNMPAEWAAYAVAAEALEQYGQVIESATWRRFTESRASIENKLAFLNRRLQPRPMRPTGAQRQEWVTSVGSIWGA